MGGIYRAVLVLSVMLLLLSESGLSYVSSSSLSNSIGSTAEDIPGYYYWGPGQGPVLFCPLHCRTDRAPERCCACHAVPCWNLTHSKTLCGINITALYVERMNLQVSMVTNPVKADVYELVSNGGVLTSIPDNICEFTETLVTLDLSNNLLKDMKGVKCLRNVDTIHMDYNLIEHIDNTSFSNLAKLRVLTLRANKLGNLGPNVLTIGDRNILTVDFAYNYLDKADVTNIIRPGPFCEISLEHSFVNEITNELGHILDQSVMHGPGYINLQHSNISHFVNFSQLGLDWSDLPDIFSGQIWIDASSLRCDCNLYPFLSELDERVGEFWPNSAETSFTCNAPESMKGVNLNTLIKNGAFQQLQCELENCPYFGICRCLDIPRDNKIIVNCTRAGLVAFPDEMPVGYWNNKNIDLILTENYVTELPDRNYMDRLVNLDLTGNYIATTRPSSVKQLTCTINMPEQRLSELVTQFSNKDPNLIEFGTHPINCDCGNLWIGDWIRVRSATGKLMCMTPDGRVVPAESVTSETLGCVEQLIPIALVVAPVISGITLLIVVGSLGFIFKYDIMVAARRYQKYRPRCVKGCYDVFVSFNEENSESYFFVANYLKPGLDAAGYLLYIPWYHLLAGVDRDAEIAKEITKCQNYVVVLSHGYLDDYNCMFEFDRIWKNFKEDKSTQIVVINLDFLDSNDIQDKRLAAFRRTHTDISFRDRNATLLERLKTRLGFPGKRKGDNEGTHRSDVITYTDLTKIHDNDGGNNELSDLEAYFATPVHIRLHMRKHECNCKYRRCYIHTDATTCAPVHI